MFILLKVRRNAFSQRELAAETSAFLPQMFSGQAALKTRLEFLGIEAIHMLCILESTEYNFAGRYLGSYNVGMKVSETRLPVLQNCSIATGTRY